MSAQLWQGKQSIRLDEPVYINGNASVVGKKEGEGPLGLLFDMVGEDDMFGCNTWEEAESSLQKDAVSLALGKAGKKAVEGRGLATQEPQAFPRHWQACRLAYG